jgi:hypothetical protein
MTVTKEFLCVEISEFSHTRNKAVLGAPIVRMYNLPYTLKPLTGVTIRPECSVWTEESFGVVVHVTEESQGPRIIGAGQM